MRLYVGVYVWRTTPICYRELKKVKMRQFRLFALNFVCSNLNVFHVCLEYQFLCCITIYNAMIFYRFSITMVAGRTTRAVSLRTERSLSRGFPSLDLDTVLEERSDPEQTQVIFIQYIWHKIISELDTDIDID